MKHTNRFKHTILFTLVLCLVVSVAMPIMSFAEEPEVTADEVAIVEKFVNDISAYLGTITDVDSAGNEDKMDNPDTGKPIIPSLEDYLDNLKKDPSYYNLREFARLWESWFVGGKAAHAVFLTDTMMDIIEPLAELIDSKGTEETNGDGTCVHFNEYDENCPEDLRDYDHFTDRTDPSTAKFEDGVPVHPIRNDVKDYRWVKRDAYHRNMYGTMDDTIVAAPDKDGDYDLVPASDVTATFLLKEKYVKVGDVYYKPNTTNTGAYKAGPYFGHPVDKDGNPTCKSCFDLKCQCDERFYINCSPDPDITVAKRTPDQLISHLVQGHDKKDDMDNPIIIKLVKELYVDNAPCDYYDTYLKDVAERMNKVSTAAEAKAIWDEVIVFMNENCKLKAKAMFEYELEKAKLSIQNTTGDEELRSEFESVVETYIDILSSDSDDGFPAYPDAGFSQYRPGSQSLSFISDAIQCSMDLIGGLRVKELYPEIVNYYSDADEGIDGNEILENSSYAYIDELMEYLDEYEETCSVKTDFSVLDKVDDPSNPNNPVNPGNQGGNKGPDNTSDSMTVVCILSLILSVGMVSVLVAFKKRYER